MSDRISTELLEVRRAKGYDGTSDAGLTAAKSSIAWVLFFVLLLTSPALVWAVWTWAW